MSKHFVKIVLIGLGILAGLWGGYYWLESNVSFEFNSNQCLNRIKQRIDFAKLHAWAAMAISESATNPIAEVHSFRELDRVWSKAPPSIWVVHNYDEEPYVEVNWGGGGGIGHRGLWVGSKQFVRNSDLVNTDLITFSQLEPGLDFWRDPH